MKKLKLFFACLLMAVLSIGQVWADDVTDELTASDLAATSTSYVDFSGVSKTSDAVYAGNSAKTSSGGIQLRSKNSNSGIVSTTSGGNVKSVTITVESGTNTIDVYGSNTAYTAASDLYGDNKGTKVGSLSATGTITFTDEYAYVGIRSNSGALYLTQVDITWTSAAPPAYTITAESNNTTYGTVSLTGSVITATRNPGYRYASPAYTVTDGTATVSQSGDAFTVTPSSDCTVQINFEAIPQYKVTWNVSGDETLKTDVYEGEKPVFPATPAACDATSTTFIGWATAPWTGKSADLSEKTVYTSASAMPDVDAAVTYYAVFAKSSGSASNLFEWAGGSSANLTAEGNHVTAQGLGSDYAAGNSPYLVKLDGTGDYIIIDTEAAIGSVEIGVKMLGGANTSSITVQEADSKDAELFTDVETLSISGAQNDVVNLATTNAFASTSRAVKLLFTKGSNVGLGPITIVGAVSMSDYMTTCCTKYAVNIAAGIEHGSISADPASACEGTTVTITFSPAGGYHLDSWSVNGTAQDVAASTFSMPAAAVEVSAKFAHDDCENLAAPTLDAVTKNYNSATIAWNEVTDAEEYAVSVVNHATSASVFAGNVDALSKALADLEPETQYDYTIMAIGDGTVKCADGNGVLEGDFTTESLPTAHLTLIDPSGTHAESGDHPILTPFNLPSTAASCAKTFMGWDPDDECATAPTYTKGQSFTFLNTTDVTLYAVYADVTGGSTSTTDIKCTVSTTTNMTGGNDADLLVDETDAADAGWIVTGYKGGGSNYPGLNKDGTIRLYYNASGNSYIDVTAPSTITSIEVTCKSGNDNIIVKVGDNTISLEDGVYPINATSFEIVNGYASSTQVHIQNIAVNFTTPGTPSNYSTTCVAAPTAEPASASIAVAAAGGEGTLGVSYENVNLAGVTVALYNNEACTEAFDGGWLTAATAGDDKHIAYNAQANTSYNDARTAYIKLTAPETNGAANPAVVVIPVEQAKKAAVFASLEDMVAADLASGTEVTVSFSNVMITEVYTTNAGYRYGLYLNVKDKDGENDIELFYNKQGESEQVPDTWVKNGYVSATNLVTTWTEYKGQWELAMQGATWSWENGDITYGAPKAVSSVVVSGEPTKKAYVDGEKFNPAGLTVTVNYTVGDPEVIAVTDADWEFTPERLAKGETGISVKATYNTVQSAAFNVTGLTVGDIQLKTIAQFIADEGGRCYLEGIVNGNINTTYGNFDLQDETGTIYVYGSDVFEDHGVAQGDKVKVIAEEYLLYKKAGNPDKDEALNVVFVSKVSAATIAIDDINMTVDDELLLSDIEATITPDAAQSATINYEVTEGTAVTISEGKIKAITEGEATITASIAAGEGYLAGSTTFTVTVSPAPVPFEGDYFVKVDDNSKLTAGEYLIVYEDGSLAFNGGLGTLDAASNTVAVTFENGKIQGTEAVLAATFTIKLAGTIQSKSGYYIGRTGNSNGMNTSKDEAYTNAISIDDGGNAVILASGGAYMRFNSTSGQERFRYFQSSSYTNQKAIQLYKKENAEPVYETVRSGLEINRYYTVCLPKKVTAIKGASFWTLNNKSQDGATAYLEEETNNLPFAAGKPFIIQATAAQLEVVYEGAATEDAGTNGALHGTLVYMDAAALAAAGSDVYMLFSNELRPVGENNHLDANRAYVKLSELNAVAEAPQGAPGKRVRAMPMQPQVATGFEAAEANEAPRKVLINGEFFIIRGEKMYDAKGQLVK